MRIRSNPYTHKEIRHTSGAARFITCILSLEMRLEMRRSRRSERTVHADLRLVVSCPDGTPPFLLTRTSNYFLVSVWYGLGWACVVAYGTSSGLPG